MINLARLCILFSGVAALASSAPTKAVVSTLTNADINYRASAAALDAKRQGRLYREYSVGGAFYPTGKLANKTISEQQFQWFPIVTEHAQLSAEESEALSNFSALDDYANVYESRWNMSLHRGSMLDMLTNYNDDGLFSMMRLRGLVGSAFGLKLKSFRFYEGVSVVTEAI
ncbi:hypothetical protein F5Y14DRAFT_451084 [Nemania sp. NC0429]|nr:hypothetical protein F5Y14DRAFT_451084 [Nemania sp. NC0429]